MSRKMSMLILFAVLAIVLVGCTQEAEVPEAPQEAAVVEEVSEEVDYSGTYIGYSWKGESKGTTLEEATQKIQTIIKLDSKGTILEADMLFWKLIDGHWTTRQSGYADVSVDFSIEPSSTTPGEDHKNGTSMFEVSTIDLMGFYAAAVSEDGTVAVMIVEPTTRHQFEMKLTPGYDYLTPISDVTINSGVLVPTYRASSKGVAKVNEWSDYADKDIFSMDPYAHVMKDRGVFKGLNSKSTMEELLESMGIAFVDGKPQPVDEVHGFHSNGGWAGNYNSIGEYLVGKNAVEKTSLVNWSIDYWGKNINEDNFFGVDEVAGATRTTQNSIDTIAGATVRMSRESTSYQRALVEAGILKEEDVIKGRF